MIDILVTIKYIFLSKTKNFRLCNASTTFQRSMLLILLTMVKDTIEIFMDDILVVGDYFEAFLDHLSNALQHCVKNMQVMTYVLLH